MRHLEIRKTPIVDNFLDFLEDKDIMWELSADELYEILCFIWSLITETVFENVVCCKFYQRFEG